MLYHLSGHRLAVGDVIEPGNWGHVLNQVGREHHCWEREQNLERVRAAEFADKPSRLASAFAFVDQQAMTWWWQFERQGDFGYIVECEDETQRSHIGDLLGVQMIDGVDASPESAARRYWSRGRPTFNTPDGLVIDELVTESALRVLAVVQRPF